MSTAPKFRNVTTPDAPALARGPRRGPRPHRITLMTLRKALDLTQVQVAESMGIAQTAVSKVEKREDVLVSTLRSYARALGMELEVAFVEGDRRYTIDLTATKEPGERTE